MAHFSSRGALHGAGAARRQFHAGLEFQPEKFSWRQIIAVADASTRAQLQLKIEDRLSSMHFLVYENRCRHTQFRCVLPIRGYGQTIFPTFLTQWE
mmetsp:Transcript_1887/g.5291  ORF Transcript_1887/g.5291 Transcript_1887/m.5291 type:complete len:96 (-) Transcript_1887:67-354(-)